MIHVSHDPCFWCCGVQLMEDLTPRGSPLRVNSFPFQQLGLSSFKSRYTCCYTFKFLIISHARYTRIQKGNYIRYITQGVANLTDWMRMRPSDIPPQKPPSPPNNHESRLRTDGLALAPLSCPSPGPHPLDRRGIAGGVSGRGRLRYGAPYTST